MTRIGRHLSSEDRAREDEQAHALFLRMLNRRPVWVDSDMGQMAWIESVCLDGDSGRLIAFDQDGNDRLVGTYLLTSPGRQLSGTWKVGQTNPG